jgi:signal transduction histidine kinase
LEISTLVQFSKLVSDSPTSEAIFSLLARTVVEECGAFHALILGTSPSGDFVLLSSHGGCEDDKVRALDLDGMCSFADVRAAVTKAGIHDGYDFRVLPLISETGLFGALVVLYSESQPLNQRQWTLVEGLTELTAISFNKAYQHQKLQKAFDDLRLSQDALIRTEKIRALGQMSAGIAHDLKNLLSPLLLYTELIRDAAGNRDEVLETSERIERILNRGLETVERLRDFSRQSSDESDATPTDLNGIVREALDISKPNLAGIELVLQLGTPPLTMIRAADCVTAIVNLLINAADALNGKGTITVRTGVKDGGACVEVSDNGPGMSAEIRSRILEPFFTTKGDSGTGLGIPTVYAFTEKYGGRLEIESEPGHGARFRMWFPSIATR